jgi:hypothetical protein
MCLSLAIRLYRMRSACGSVAATSTVKVPPAGTAVCGLTVMAVISGGVLAEACPVYACFSAW